MQLLSTLLIPLLWSSVFSLSLSQIGVTDWHKALVGVPQTDGPQVVPVFHRLASTTGKLMAFLLTSTSSNVMAALDPGGGSVVWRHINEPDDPIVAFKPNSDGLVVLSGPGGATARLLEVATGQIIWESRLHKPQDGLLLQLQSLGTAIAFAVKSADIVVLAEAQTVHRLHGLTGAKLWTWTSDDQTSSVIYTQILTFPSAIYVIGALKSFDSYSVHVTTLNPETGAVIASRTIPSKVENASRDILALAGLSQPRLAWIENGDLKAVRLPPDLTLSSPIVESGFSKIVDITLAKVGFLVAERSDYTSCVFRADASKELRKIWDYGDKKSAAPAPSVYSGGFDKEGRPYVSRVYWSKIFGSAGMELFAPHGLDGMGTVTGYNFPFDTENHGIIRQISIDVAHPRDMQFLSRFTVTTSTGAFQLWGQEKLQWVREEGMTATSAAAFVDLPQLLLASDGKQYVSGFGHRISRHMKGLDYLPNYLIRFTSRWFSGFYFSSQASEAAQGLWKDQFGFKKLVIMATTYGRIYAVESTSGKIVWSQLLGASDPSGVPSIGQMRLLIDRKGGSDMTSDVYLVLEANYPPSGTRSHIYHFDALTGRPIGPKSAKGYTAAQYEIPGSFSDAVLLKNQGGVLVVDDTLKAHIYPVPSSDSQEALHLVLQTGPVGERKIGGYAVSSQPDRPGSNIRDLRQLWTSSFGDSDAVTSIIKAVSSPTASYGKVLGNRTTLYKYLNPHLTAVLSKPTTTGECRLLLLDGLKGTVLYHASLPMVDGDCGIQAVVVDNWLVYSHYGTSESRTSSITSVELYEGNSANDKTSSPDLSSFSSDAARLRVFAQSFAFPHRIQAMFPTSTKFGIALKNIVVATDNNQILEIPHRLLDPRRIKGKPTSEEQEEGLLPFDPVLPDDPKRVITHNKAIVGKSILTSASQLESTSVVFSYGLDLFQTRVTPSGTFDLLSEDFNRTQLGFTILGLLIAILITRPIVRSKALKSQWYP